MTKNIENVQPIRSTDDIATIKYFLKNTKYGQRNLMIFLIGINTGLRCSDIVKLKIGTVKYSDKPFIYEKKTSKKRQINLKGIYNDIQQYLIYLDSKGFKSDDDYLFPSRKRDANGQRQPIGVQGYYKVLAKVGYQLGRDDLGTHTMRKTFGYHFYKKTHDIMQLSNILNHESPKTTERYIGITADEINDTLDDFRIG